MRESGREIGRESWREDRRESGRHTARQGRHKGTEPVKAERKITGHSNITQDNRLHK